MVLMAEEDIKRTPRRSRGKNPTAYVKLFCPWSNWSWFIVEYDPKERIAFGLVYGLEAELGEFSLDELESITGPGGLKIERDIHFDPLPLSECDDPCCFHNNPCK